MDRAPGPFTSPPTTNDAIPDARGSIRNGITLDTPYVCLCDVLAYAGQSILPHQKNGKWEIGWHAWHSYYSVQKDAGLNACIAGLQGALILFVKTRLKAEHDRAEDARCKADRNHTREFFQFEGAALYEALPALQLKSAAAMALVARMDALLQLTDEQFAAREPLLDALEEVEEVAAVSDVAEDAAVNAAAALEMRELWEMGQQARRERDDPVYRMLSETVFAPTGKGVS